MPEDQEMQRLQALYEPIIGKKPQLTSDFAAVYACLAKGEKGIIIKFPNEPREIVIMKLEPVTGIIRYADASAEKAPPGGFSMTKGDLEKLMASGAVAFL